MNAPRVTFAPNVPQILALRNTEGELGEYNEVTYQLTDGRPLIVSHDVAVKINLLELEPLQTFQMCKRWSGERKDPIYWDIALTAATEREKAQQEAEQPPSDIETKLAASIGQVRSRPQIVQRKPISPQRNLFEDRRGNGTTGPAPQPQKAVAVAPAKPQRFGPIPYNVAFREVTKFVTEELNANGEQWADEAKQGMISTILIAAAKQGILGPWER